MMRAFQLLLPALIPSWAFFKAVEPSPRVQWRLHGGKGPDHENWQEFRPRPARLPLRSYLRRMFWNPRWNDQLYLVSLAERLMLSPTAHSEDEIFDRLAYYLGPGQPRDAALEFRLIFVHRQGARIVTDITYQAAPRALADLVS